MSKKKQTKTRKAVKVTAANLQAAQDARELNINVVSAPPMPSHRAMNLAAMALRLATGRAPTPKSEEAQAARTIQVADAIDSALRIDRANGESSGLQKAKEEHERLMVEGIMARIGMNSLMKPGPKTIVLSFIEAKVLKRALEAAGYTDGIPRAHQQAWQQVTDEDMHASLNQRAA